MTFRNELRQALSDDVPAYPPAGLRERVLETALVRKRRPRKEKMVYRLRISLALVAAVLVVAVGAAAVITWNALHQSNVSPAGGINLTTLQQLEARPLVMPRATSQQTCSDHPGANTLGFDYGDGPVYGNGGAEITGTWGYYWDVMYYVAANVRGPILVRGEDRMTGKRQVFVDSKTEGVVTGAAVGTDATQNPSTLREEMVLDPTKAARMFKGLGEFKVRQGLPKDYVGCFGIQMDGPTFTEWIGGWTQP